MVKVSVIVPVYNVEEFLGECLDSVINQTFSDFELICVNDCSTDSSLEILEKYALLDSRIKIIQTEINSGLGFARNHGLKYAKGDYILFLDSDDYILDNTLEKLYINATRNESDIVLFKFLHLVNGHFSYNYIPINLDKFLKRTDFEDFVFDYKIAPYIAINEQYSACIKFYKKSFLDSYDDFYFPVGLAYEDAPFHVKAMLRASKMTFIPECFYVYRRSVSSSITHNYSHVYDILEIINLVEEFLKKENYFDELIIEFYKFKIRQLLMYVNQSKYEDFFKLAKEQLENLDSQLVYSALHDDDKHYQLIYDFDNVLTSNSFEEFESKKNVVQYSLPNLSVIVSVNNNTNTINNCLDSIFSVFIEDIEVICIDEGSSDDSLKNMLNYRIENDKDFLIYFDQYTDSKELGLTLAKGQHIIFISGDEYIQDKITCLDKLNHANEKIIPSEEFTSKISDSIRYENNFPKLSIIIPVYNCENSISECLNSLLSQSFTDFEVICVDDGSTDNSLEVLQKFASKYDCIKVLTQKNKGSGSARNLGLASSVGKYISFVDADDTVVNIDAYNKLIEFAEKYKMNMVSANLQILKRGKLVFEDDDFRKIEKLNFKSSEDYGIPWFFYKNIFNKNFLMENQIIFPDLKRGQDTVFLAKILSKLDTYLEVPIPFYQYVAPTVSKINSFNSFLGYYESFYEVFKVLTPQKRFTKLINEFSQKLIDLQYLRIPIETEEELTKLLYVFDEIKELFIIWNDESLLNRITNSFNKVVNKCNVDIPISSESNNYHYRYSFLLSETKTPEISVILSVFNMEPYLSRCINSVLMQSFDNLEIICIDDFSTDDSYEILKNFQKNDIRVKVFQNDSHMGAGYTKNRGINESKGKYIYFLNPHDWINLDSFEFLFNIAEKDSLELILSEPLVFNEDTFKFEFNHFNFRNTISFIQNDNVILNEINFNELINMAFSNIFVLKSYLLSDNIFFSKKSYSEDDLNFFFEVLFNTSNFRLIDSHVQNYVVSTNIVRDIFFVNLWFVQLILNFFFEKQLFSYYKKELLNFIFNLMKNNLSKISSKNTKFDWDIEKEFIKELNILFDKLYFDYKLYDDLKDNLTKDNFDFFNNFLVNKSKYRMSIIIPIFNAEKYLRRTLDSILNQYLNYKSLEIIMVDDHSTDNSTKIMEEYCEKYPNNFKAIFLDKNSGYAGKPRNIALNNVTSDYVFFLDADDYVMKNGYKRLYQEIITEKGDIVIGNYTSDLPSGKKKYNIDSGISPIVSFDEYSKFKFNSINHNEHILSSVNIWNKLFKLNVINDNGIKFPEGVPAEDSAFLLNYLFNAKGIIFVNECVNHYHSLRNNEDNKSVSHLRTKINIFGRLKSYKFMYDLSKKFGKEEAFCKFLLINKLGYLFEQMFETDLNNDEIISIFNDYQILFERIHFYNLNTNDDLSNIYYFIANSKFDEALNNYIHIKNKK